MSLVDSLIKFSIARDRIFDLRLYQIPENIHELIVAELEGTMVKPVDIEGMLGVSETAQWQKIHQYSECDVTTLKSFVVEDKPPCSVLLCTSNLTESALEAIKKLQNPCVGVLLRSTDIPDALPLLAAPITMGDSTLLVLKTAPIPAANADAPVANPTIASGMQLKTLAANASTHAMLLARWMADRARKQTPAKEIFRLFETCPDDESAYDAIHTLIHGDRAVKARPMEVEKAPEPYPDSRARKICGVIRKLTPPRPWSPRAVLDIGCDDGALVKELKNEYRLQASDAVGMDLRPLENAADFTYLQTSASADHSDLDNRFDLIVISMTLHHISAWHTVLANAHTWLAPGGILVVRDHDASSNDDRILLDAQDTAYALVVWPQQEMPWSHHALTACSWFSSAEDVVEAARGVGLEPVRFVREGNRSSPVAWEERPTDRPAMWLQWRMVYYLALQKPADTSLLTNPKIRSADSIESETGVMHGFKQEKEWLFPPVDARRRRVDRDAIAFDGEGLRFVTATQYAEATCDYVLELLPMVRSLRHNKCTMVDATAGLGGNTIGFGLTMEQMRYPPIDHTVSIELDSIRYQCLKENLALYDVKAEAVNGNFLSYHIPRHSIVFADPPWGGDDYSKLSTIPVSALGFITDDGSTLPLDQVCRDLIYSKGVELVVLKLPYNYDCDGLVEVVGPNEADIHTLYEKVTLVAMWGSEAGVRTQSTVSVSEIYQQKQDRKFGGGRRARTY
ncbi:RNA cap guanine-N2 methyltransferase [Carpediemonas membranifera]|uniref:Trimethylguanosine synthase n=1 Tax=Carpediemonas membranifera TaxID=201153 RepID=A0A8J6AWW8_9EUKA|nr:RNA cap guanine-N2 methyltransferase [Carpediemonas membranifera]|eukprot:KAG9396193.1 RNA cap guanine-N2 methyltransferase [Carpediemonas membranifera]